MFLLQQLKDTILLQPSEVKGDFFATIKERIQNKYHLKLISQVGLVIAVIDIQSTNGHILIGEGSTLFEVTLKCVIFSTQQDELFKGVIIKSIKEGLVVQHNGVLESFVPGSLLQEGSVFTDEGWIWQTRSGLYHYDEGEEVYFKTKIFYTDSKYFEEKQNIDLCQVHIGAMNQLGLGVVRWFE